MTGIQDALATLRGILADCQDVLSAPDVDRGMDALARVKDEIARLEQEQESWHRIADDNLDRVYAADQHAERAEAEIARLAEERDAFHATLVKWTERAEAAEAEVARLRDGLRRMAESEQATTAGYVDGEVLNWQPTYGTAARELARALLAEAERGEFHAEGLDERGIYGGRSHDPGGAA